MQDLLNQNPIYFPSRNDNLYSLKQFLNIVNNNCHNKYRLPIIVKIRSLNNYGRSIKNLVGKNTLLLLLDICQLDSILAEYHRSHEGRSHSNHRRRLSNNHGRISAKLSRMKNLSKSLASLTAPNHLEVSKDQEFFDTDSGHSGTGITYQQRNLVKTLNERRSPTVPLCRIPLQYRNFFELLDESDKAIQPCHQISDLRIVEYDSNDPDKRTEKWPHAFLLRDSCVVYTKKQTTENLHPTSNGRSSHSTASSDSCYGSSSDFHLKKDVILLDDDKQTLPSGCILTIISECQAIRRQTSEKDIRQPAATPSPPPSSSKNWFKSKSKMLFSRKYRHSFSEVELPSESPPKQSSPSRSESYLKCRTQQGGDIVYISFGECGLFSPLNGQTHRLKSSTEIDDINPSGIFRVKDLISSFRLPVSVRLLDGNLAFESLYSTATISREHATMKLRLRMLYNERVVFACPLSPVQPKLPKTSSPYIVIPFPENADIEIQPCLNMDELLQSETFNRLLHTCSQLIEQYSNEISLIHFPLQCADNINRQKRPLYKKRSQSESHLDLPSKHQFRQSDEPLDPLYQRVDGSSSLTSSPSQSHDAIDSITKVSLTNNKQQSTSRALTPRSRMKIYRQKKCSFDDYTPEDEIYEDVDKIYDYIRSGNVTDDVQKIQAKEQVYDSNHSSPAMNKAEQPGSEPYPSPGQMITHRFPSPGLDFKPADNEDEDAYEYHSCKNDGNVDDNQAHALFLAAKRRSKDNIQTTLLSKSALLLKRTHKH